jgi:hypothetical protein
MPSGRTPILRRQAIQVVALLPEDTKDALAVLDHARELLTQFVESPIEADVVQFPIRR